MHQHLEEASLSERELRTTEYQRQVRIHTLELELQKKERAIDAMQQRFAQAVSSELATMEKLASELTRRWKLQNQVRELKGNIRVFCRVRPQDGIDVSDMASIKYSDRREIELTYPRNEATRLQPGAPTRPTSTCSHSTKCLIRGPRTKRSLMRFLRLSRVLWMDIMYEYSAMVKQDQEKLIQCR
ncbi:hypothetical protein V1517DRAFT_334510 [Lipomyces orientalis]|uniref:Uncharacterized protein n=1 Tax=Lipomyces orientalis TaxID=1233043 RepID=A0ACC3TDG7_9ASCO